MLGFDSMLPRCCYFMLAWMAPGIQLARLGCLMPQFRREVSVPHADHRFSFAERGSELLISSRHGAMKWPLSGLRGAQKGSSMA